MATFELILTLVSSGGVVAFALGVYQYREAQQWKRLEFVASEIRALKDDPSARTMMQILDWDGRRADLFPAKEKDRWVLVTHDDLARALRIHTPRRPDLSSATGETDRNEPPPQPDEVGTSRTDQFESKEARLRDLADAFLEHLDRFGHFVESGLVDAHEFAPYLRYWFDLIADTYDGRPIAGEARAWRRALQIYIAAYGYRGVIALANGLGYEMADAPGR